MPAYQNISFTRPVMANATAPVTTVMNPSYLQFLETVIRGSDAILLDADTAQKGGAFEELIRQISPLLGKYRKTLIVPQAGMHELRQLAASVDVRTREKAVRALEGLNALASVGIVSFRGNPNVQESAGEAIIRYVSRNVWEQEILVLTQDGALAADCRLFSAIKSAHLPHGVTVKRISDVHGRLNNFAPAPGEERSESAPGAPEDPRLKNILNRFGC